MRKYWSVEIQALYVYGGNQNKVQLETQVIVNPTIEYLSSPITDYLDMC